MKKLLLLSVVVFFTVLISCSRKSTPQSSTEEAKAEVKITSYAAAIQPLIQAKCSPCHIPSAGGNKTPLDSYDGAKNNAAEIIRRVQLNPGEKGYMPFKRDKLTPEEIAVFKNWLADGTTE